MKQPAFPTNYASILARVDAINPVAYAKSRNFVDGAVTYLSPYISRGAISLPQVAQSVLKKFNYTQAEKLIQELAWREYWLRVWEAKGDEIHTDLKNEQTDVAHHQMISAIDAAQTGIRGVDEGIENLYATGYMHNHIRMYTASIACNIGKAHWQEPARWMYYHLIDGDPASNHLSWQWVAGAFSSKKYYCNQENISRYTSRVQTNTFLDHSYETLPELAIPPALTSTYQQELVTPLPTSILPGIDNEQPVWLFNSFNLDPTFAPSDAANRVLVLDPAHFNKYPVSERVINFMLELASSLIPGIQVFVGSPQLLKQTYPTAEFHFRNHPTTVGYPGIAHTPPYLFPEVAGYHGSFFAYWKKCERYIGRLKP